MQQNNTGLNNSKQNKVQVYGLRQVKDCRISGLYVDGFIQEIQIGKE